MNFDAFEKLLNYDGALGGGYEFGMPERTRSRSRSRVVRRVQRLRRCRSLGRTVVIDNLHHRISEEHVCEFLSSAHRALGREQILNVQIVRDSMGRSQCVAVVEFRFMRSMRQALALSGLIVDGQAVRVQSQTEINDNRESKRISDKIESLIRATCSIHRGSGVALTSKKFCRLVAKGTVAEFVSQ